MSASSRRLRLWWSLAALVIVVGALAAWLRPREGPPETALPQTLAEANPVSPGGPSDIEQPDARPSEPTETSAELRSDSADEPIVIRRRDGDGKPLTLITEQDIPAPIINTIKSIDEYFEAPPHKRVEILDRQIDAMQEMSKRVQQALKARRLPEGGRPEGPQAIEITVEERDGERKVWVGQGDPDPKKMRRAEKRMLETDNPEMRAKIAEYTKALKERMKERGMEGAMMMMIAIEEEDN